MTMLRLVTLLATAALGPAQSVVLPSARATTPPPSNFLNTALFTPPESHTQLVYDVLDVPVPVAYWTSLQVRRSLTSLVSQPFSSNATIVLSVSPLSPESTTLTFAANLGTTLVTTVFKGPIALPAPTTSPWPAPWEAPIAFSSAFLYVGAIGKALVVDITQTGTSPAMWTPESSPPDLGSSSVVLSPLPSCALVGGAGYSIAQSASRPYVGGIWTIGYTPVGKTPYVGFPTFAAIGVSGPGGSWNGAILPIDLTPLGAPGCQLAVSIDLLVPMTAYTTGALRSDPIAIPKDPALGRQKLYDQGLLLDPTANTLGVVTAVSSISTIGTGLATGGLVLATGAGSATAPTASSYMSGYTTTIRLN